jgi:hypothetical protein
MVRAVLYDPWLDFSQYDGLTGYGRYWMTRLHHQTPSAQAQKCLLYITKQIEENLPDIPSADQTNVYCLLHDLRKIQGVEMCKSLLAQFQKQTVNNFPRLGDSVIGNIIRMVQYGYYFDHDLHNETHAALKQIPTLDLEKPPAGTGLLKGTSKNRLFFFLIFSELNFAQLAQIALSRPQALFKTKYFNIHLITNDIQCVFAYESA